VKTLDVAERLITLNIEAHRLPRSFGSNLRAHRATGSLYPILGAHVQLSRWFVAANLGTYGPPGGLCSSNSRSSHETLGGLVSKILETHRPPRAFVAPILGAHRPRCQYYGWFVGLYVRFVFRFSFEMPAMLSQ